MSHQKSWQKLDALCVKLHALGHASAILGADEATNMPTGGGESRANAVSVLAGMRHELATAPEIADNLAEIDDKQLSADQNAALVEFKRQYRNMTCLPSEFVQRQTEIAMRSEQKWRALRAEGDWDSFAPSLQELIELTREEATMRATALGLSPYDALMEQFDPGNRTVDISPVFDRAKNFLKGFVPQVLEAQAKQLERSPRREIKGPYSLDAQRELGIVGMKALGFDFNHGRLDVSHHPFCGGVPSDIRMTTRYSNDEFLTALMGTLHETGHALYEQGLPKNLAHWPSAQARGMSLHESQSLFVEWQIARSPEFWEWALPLAKQHIGEQISDWSITDVLTEVNHVERGLIRVDADEVTYPLHIIMRYEMEQDLVAGKMQATDIPEVWDAKMQEYLGLRTIDDPANGPMQDVHWPAGAFGYFPSYALGGMMAAQQWAAMEKEIPTANDQIKMGDFSEINAWRHKNIWQLGSTLSTPEIMTKATGEPLNAKYLEAHLKNRYLR